MAKSKNCKSCGKPSAHLGAMSGTCPACQNKSVSELETSLSLSAGVLGVVCDVCGSTENIQPSGRCAECMK